MAPAEMAMPMPDSAAVAAAYPSVLPPDIGEVSTPALESSEDAQPNPALKLAGGVLLLNAVLVLVEKVVAPQVGGGFPGSSNFVPAIIDAFIGVSLLRGNDKYRSLATVRVVLGLVILTVIHLVQKNVIAAVFQFFFSGTLLMLLLGSPSALRRGLALAGVGLCMLVEGVGLYALHTGNVPFANKFAASTYDAEPIEGDVVQGRAFAFHMSLPGASWLLRKEEAAHRDNPLADLWLVDPDSGSHLLIIGEKVSGDAQVSMERFADAVIKNVRKGTVDFDPSEPDYRIFEGMPACSIRGTGRVNGAQLDYEIRLLSAPGAIYQLIAFGPSDSFGEVRGDVVASMDAFRLE
ncbi:hypothetical protein F0U61_13075 [Archangium violaceum]|uniref:hypothetical protein n=1 Tax=Archangium violaceum TaxID=83451 RepID=UPI002B31437F|nr:hypothetical protein F0U61_13075 [Archangium violaceum]